MTEPIDPNNPNEENDAMTPPTTDELFRQAGLGQPIEPADVTFRLSKPIPPTPSPESQNQIDEAIKEDAFRDYFHNLMEEVLDGAIPKAKTYGTHELVALGRTLNQTYRPDQNLTDSQAFQVACWFYASGKLARWHAARGRGEQPTTDTVLDLMVYCLMWLKVSETGEWWS